MNMTRRSLTCVIGLLALFHVAAAAEEPLVRVVRVPNGGIQPQVAKDDAGIVHLIYFKGNARAGDLFYVTSGDGGRTFSKPMHVNSQEGSVLAIGTMRGAQLAVGKAGRAHVSWMGSDKAQPRGPGGEGVTPMLYARLNDAKTTFEEQRNVIQEKAGLDGGGSVAADSQGRVYVAWHAPSKRQGDEADRRVWLAVSSDEGKTFAKEQPISPSGLGSCGCCGMRLLAAGDAVYALFRSAREMVHRDMYLIKMKDEAGRAVGSQNPDLKSQISDHSAHKLDEWQTGTCPASTAAFTHAKGDVLRVADRHLPRQHGGLHARQRRRAGGMGEQGTSLVLTHQRRLGTGRCPACLASWQGGQPQAPRAGA
jgi:hypothetical protein